MSSYVPRACSLLCPLVYFTTTRSAENHGTAASNLSQFTTFMYTRSSYKICCPIMYDPHVWPCIWFSCVLPSKWNCTACPCNGHHLPFHLKCQVTFGQLIIHISMIVSLLMTKIYYPMLFINNLLSSHCLWKHMYHEPGYQVPGPARIQVCYKKCGVGLILMVNCPPPLFFYTSPYIHTSHEPNNVNSSTTCNTW